MTALLCLGLAALTGLPGRAQADPAASAPPTRAAVLARAQHLRAEHRPQAAADLLRSYLQQQPGDAEALMVLGDALADGGQRDAAGRAFADALAANPSSVPANDAVGRLLLQEHKDPEAMDRFEAALATAPRDPAAREGERTAATELALAARQKGHPEVALEVLQHACSQLPDDPQLLLDLGIQATELQQWPEAQRALHAALTLDPANPTVLYALARADFEQQRMPEAEGEFKAYLAKRPDDASAHFGLGHLYAMEQRTADARAEFETSLRLQPRQTASRYELGQLALEAHQDPEAASNFAKVLESDPNHAGALTGMGELALRAKDYARAEQYLARAETADPSYPTPHYYRGLALARLGRQQEAEAELQRGDSRQHATAPADPAAPAAAPHDQP